MSFELVKTHKVPQDGRAHGLPPHMGRLPLALARDADQRFVSPKWLNRDVILAPLADAQAMWINFCDPPTFGGILGQATNYPFAIMIATGKVNSIDGSPYEEVLRADPYSQKHNYVVPGTLGGSGRQRWLDGVKMGDGTVRQFVATTLEAGTSIEQFMTGKVEFGGYQVFVVPMRADIWEQVKPRYRSMSATRGMDEPQFESLGGATRGMSREMHVTAGGQISQQVECPKFTPDMFDMSQAMHFWITLVPHQAWPALTGTSAPRPTPDAAPHSPFAGAPGVKSPNAVGQGNWD